MQLDYIDHYNEYDDNIVRLYDFDMAEANKFRQIVQQSILVNMKTLNLASIDFIDARNCNLTLRISEEDEGITTENNVEFYCDLTTNGYRQMIILLEQFCSKETKGYQFLYDIYSHTDFLFSPAGTW